MYVGLGKGVTEVEYVDVCEGESGCESVLLHCLQLVVWCVRNAYMHEQKFSAVLPIHSSAPFVVSQLDPSNTVVYDGSSPSTSVCVTLK